MQDSPQERQPLILPKFPANPLEKEKKLNPLGGVGQGPPKYANVPRHFEFKEQGRIFTNSPWSCSGRHALKIPPVCAGEKPRDV